MISLTAYKGVVDSSKLTVTVTVEDGFEAFTAPLVVGQQVAFAATKFYRLQSPKQFSQWRDDLARAMHYRADTSRGRYHYLSGAATEDSGPFWELLLAPDQDIIFGSVCCSKLARDFQKSMSVCRNMPPNFQALYKNIGALFAFAGADGCLVIGGKNDL